MSAGSPSRSPSSARRRDALSRERIVAAAVEILDAQGEAELTFRTLAARLATGSGALYHHVAGKQELLVAATREVVSQALRGVRPTAAPEEAVRGVALAVFDVVDAHPWVGAQLAREPWQPAVLDVLEAFGAQLEPMGVPEAERFDCASALVCYVVGLAGQYAAAARLVEPGTSRSAFLGEAADRWRGLDPEAYPFVRSVAARMAEHEDRPQFLAGVDLLLAGIRGRAGR